MERDILQLDTCDAECGGTLSKSDGQTRILPGAMSDRLALVFKSLADRTRLRIIYALQPGELCVHDLTVLLDMTQSAVSHQLRYLRDARIVKRRKEGKTVYYSLDDEHIEQMVAQMIRHVDHD